jgi:hypothetical protein
VFRPRPFAVLAAVVAVGYTAAIVVFVLRHWYFFGDDYSAFLHALRKPLSADVLASMGGQFVPLAKALNWAFFRLFGLDYGAAVAVLVVCHLVGIGYLYATFALSKQTPLNAALVALYAAYVFTWIELGWWIAGLERVPFVMCATAAIYHYLRYVDTRNTRHLVAVVVANAAALGFYGKGVFVPLYMVAVDLARLPAARLRLRFERGALQPWLVAGALFVANCACLFAGARMASDARGALGRQSAHDFFLYVALAGNVFAHSLLGLVLTLRPHEPKLAVAVFFLFVVGFTIRRVPRAWLAWLLWFALILANIVLIGVANRAGALGPLLAFENRYYWELVFFTVLFVGMIFHRLPRAAPEVVWASKGRRSAVLAAAGAVLLVAYSVVSYGGATKTASAISRDLPKSRAYVETLRADIAALESKRDGSVRIVDGELPVYLTGVDLSFRSQSDLVALFRDRRIAFRPTNRAEYEIDPDGHLSRLQPHQRRKKR